MDIEPFSVRITEEHLSQLQAAISASRLPPPFYEGTKPEFGVTSEWMREAKSRWLQGYDWRAFEQRINKFPQFIAKVTYRSSVFKIHFVHVRATSTPAGSAPIPIVLLHGWPGSFVEFLDVIEPLSAAGFDLVVPSLPGFAWSARPPLDRDFKTEDCAEIMGALMEGLGYAEYVAQGGDLGSPIAREMAVKFPACKVVHLNFQPRILPPQGYDASTAEHSDFEKLGLERSQTFGATGSAYARMHATRPSTISHVLFASPVGLLAWIAEKFLAWTDEPHPSIDAILNIVTLWWLTDTYPTSIYMYRELLTGRKQAQDPQNLIPASKLLAFSSFPLEVYRFPRSWIATSTERGEVDWSKEHSKGGHFAAFERPGDMVQDLRESIAELWPKRQSADKSDGKL